MKPWETQVNEEEEDQFMKYAENFSWDNILGAPVETYANEKHDPPQRPQTAGLHNSKVQ